MQNQAAPIGVDAPGPAKPPVGTPPFAMPHPNTGGAEPAAQGAHADMIGQAFQHLVGRQQQQPQQHGFSGFMDRLVNPTNALGQLGQALLMGGGGPLGKAMAVLDVQHQRKAAAGQNEAKLTLDQLRWDAEQQDKIAERNKPQYFSGSEDRVMLDPASGQTKVLYDAPTPGEAYAKSLGLDTTTDAGRTALKDYVLRSSGPTALEGDLTLEDTRFGNRAAIRGMPTWKQAQGRLPGALATRPSAAPRRAARSAGSYPEGTVIKNAAGQRMQRKGGQWVAM